jgi:hypothetical protein
VTIALRVLALDEEALRGQNVGFTARFFPLFPRKRTSLKVSRKRTASP